MIIMDLVQLTKDFAQRYAGTYIWLTVPDRAKDLVLIRNVYQDDEETEFPLIEYQSVEFGKNTIRFNTDSKLEFIRPPIGVFQFEKEAALIQRTGTQSYSKGVSEETYLIQRTYHNTRLVLAFSKTLWAKALKESFEPKFKSLTQALTLLEKGYISVALSNRFSITLSHDDNNSYDIYHYSTFVGKVDKNGNPKFKTEHTVLNSLIEAAKLQ